MNIAFKCTYNNGGEGILVGFNGVCSEDIIKRNIEQGRIWCNNRKCLCRKYYNSGFKGSRPRANKSQSPCNESVLFRDWWVGSGAYHSGPKEGEGIPLKQATPGDIVILTTRFPGDKEVDRKIIGLFEITIAAEKGQVCCCAHERYRIRLPLEEAKSLFLWDYYSVGGGKPMWGTGLHRYLDDTVVAAILRDVLCTIKDDESKLIVQELLSRKFAAMDQLPRGMRKRRQSRAQEIAQARKYSVGGEGKDHKKLKKRIATNPQFLGIINSRSVTMEHQFISGDAVDILFELNDGTDAVVEI